MSYALEPRLRANYPVSERLRSCKRRTAERGLRKDSETEVWPWLPFLCSRSRLQPSKGQKGTRNNTGTGQQRGQARAEQVQNANKKGDQDKSKAGQNRGKHNGSAKRASTKPATANGSLPIAAWYSIQTQGAVRTSVSSHPLFLCPGFYSLIPLLISTSTLARCGFLRASRRSESFLSFIPLSISVRWRFAFSQCKMESECARMLHERGLFH